MARFPLLLVVAASIVAPFMVSAPAAAGNAQRHHSRPAVASPSLRIVSPVHYGHAHAPARPVVYTVVTRYVPSYPYRPVRVIPSPGYAMPVSYSVMGPPYPPAPAPGLAAFASPVYTQRWNWTSVDSIAALSGRQDVGYFCPDSRKYYPEVKTCPSDWLKVVP